MEQTKRVILGVQKKNNKRKQSNKKSLFKKVVRYLKSDTYMFAPLIKSPKINSSSSSVRGAEIKEPIKGKNEPLLKKVVDYLKSDTYMYSSLIAPQPITSRPKGSTQHVNRVTTEISTRMLTAGGKQPTVQSANMIAEKEKLFKENQPGTNIAGPLTLEQMETVKKIVHSNCRSSSILGKRMLSSQLRRKLLVD